MLSRCISFPTYLSSPLSQAIFTTAAIPVLEAGSVPAGDLRRVGTPLVNVVVEIVVVTLSRGWILVLF